MPTAAVRDVGHPDRGPWPTWWRVTLSALVVLAGVVAIQRVRRRRARSAVEA